MDSRKRQELIAASHRLDPLVTLAARELSDAVVAQVRQCFAKRELIKVRLRSEERAEADALAAALAAAVPCELVKRIGRIAVLYRPPAPAEPAK